MKRLKLKFREQVSLPLADPERTRALKVRKGTEVQVDRIHPYVLNNIEMCDLTMLGGNVATGVRYEWFQFVD